MEDWSHRSPVSFRVGGVGFGAGVGCGVGLGFGKRLSLGGIPGVGQVSSGITSGLSSLPGGIGNIGYTVSNAIKKLGVDGLGGGLGCGVGIGYGFGVGLVLKPSALESGVTMVQQWIGGLVHSLFACHTNCFYSSLMAPGVFHGGQKEMTLVCLGDRPCRTILHGPTEERWQMECAGAASKRMGGENAIRSFGQQHVTGSHSDQPTLSPPQTNYTTTAVSASGKSDSLAKDFVTVADLEKQSTELKELQDTTIQLMRRSLKQQEEIDSLKAENAELKTAICKVVKKAPFCKAQ